MKKNSFLQVDFSSTIKLTPPELRIIHRYLDLASRPLEELISRGLLKTKVPSISVSVLLCGESRIRALNSQHRNKDKVTDVLSFPSFENLRSQKLQIQDDLFIGDIAICHQVTKRQAKEFNISYGDEFIHLFFHGLIHLLGYDHEVSEKEEKLMQKWEDEVVSLLSKHKKKGS